MCQSAQSYTLSLWSVCPTALRTQGVCAYESVVVVRAFLIGCAVFLMAGASGVQAEDSNKEETRCEGTRKTNVNLPGLRTTNDLAGCPKGGLLLGTNKGDLLAGEKGDDEVRGLGGSDDIMGGDGNDVLYGGSQRDFVGGYDGDDVIYGGEGDDEELFDGKGDDVIYGGDGDDLFSESQGADVIYGGNGNDSIAAFSDGQPDKVYCGKGKDEYHVEEKIDHVSSSCEKKFEFEAIY